MQETITANIGSMAFTLDKDAYNCLQVYFADIERRLPPEEIETLSDLEARMAELLREQVPSSMRVISLKEVRHAIETLGEPECFGEGCTPPHPTPDQASPMRLRRSITDRSIAGICAGIAKTFNIDVTLVRLLTLALILCGGLSIWIYLVLWIVIPSEEYNQQ